MKETYSLILSVEITGDEGNKAIQLERMKAEKEFWEMLDANVEKVERWYISQMEHFTEQFHILTLQAIQLVRPFREISLFLQRKKTFTETNGIIY
jgi:hypothetical protein